MSEASPVPANPQDAAAFRKSRVRVFIGFALATGLMMLSFKLAESSGDGFRFIPVMIGGIVYLLAGVSGLVVALITSRLDTMKMAAGLVYLACVVVGLTALVR